ncbi:hybrid non-ribosomal peptide synthetase/type I polyketide synthase [Rhodopseudomonas palustris]|uniref:L-cysteine--[L-cysteinyl-carrier protein] ligase n=1 Tax=Rhodopseudomonas palustris (strain BisB18) TaxID=316056 RepID=Q212V5_RHOPB
MCTDADPGRSSRDTLVSRLEKYAQLEGGRPALDFVDRSTGTRTQLSYGELSHRVKAVAVNVQDALVPGGRALLLLPSGHDYVVALLACLYAGAVAVPVNLPGASRVARVLGRVEHISRDCGATAILTTRAIADQSREALTSFVAAHRLRLILIDDAKSGRAWSGYSPSETDIAFIQYTSGSTAEPKGVINRHDTLISNVSFLRCLLWPKDAPVVASWLPLFHDMGLIMGVLAPLALGGRVVYMAPGAFVSDPLMWLELAARERAAVLPCPAFALDACVEHYDADRLRDLDLSCVESLVPAAEPVHLRQVRAFFDLYSRHGLHWGAIRPSYGLAEATLIASGSSHDGGPVAVSVDAASIARGTALVVTDGAPDSRVYLSNGADFGGQDLRIVDPETRRTKPAGDVGEIWISGAAIAAGYWGRSDATEETFAAHLSDDGASDATNYLRTGDLGFLHGGHLYITGRSKDVMIFRGQCHYPNDIEASLANLHDDIIAGGAAAFAIPGDQGVERLVVVQEVRRHSDLDAAALEASIRETIAREHGLAAHDVVLIRRGTLKRTTSGKVRRAEMRRLYISGGLTIVGSDRQPAGQDTRSPSREQRRDAVRGKVLDCVRRALGPSSPRVIDPARSLFALGLDSLAATQAVAALERDLGRSLPEGVLFDYPTVDALSDWLVSRAEEAPCLPPDQPLSRREAGEPLAIVGLSCLFPAGANDIEDPAEFWRWLMTGGDAVRGLAADRFRQDLDIPGYGACLRRVDGFDAAFFGVGPREAMNMDPQQRLLLEATWHALEDAGFVPQSLRGSDTGVFVGVGTGDYGHLPFVTRDPAHLDPYYGTGNAFAAVAGRISYVFDWSGPSIAVDTACSASHAAVHLACQSLRTGESSLAVAAGVKLQILPEIDLVLARAGMLAADGRCKTFDAAADGYVRGEGAGVVVIKRLADALRDGDPIRAVIRESVLSQDGASASLSAPNSEAQRRMLSKALARAEWTPADVDYVELHGTGTRLGDPIEFEALASVFFGRDATDPLYLGSVKTNIGHLEAAAGIAGLIKVVLALQEGRIPPNLHYNRPNPAIDLARIPAVIPTAPIDWPLRGDRRRAGVTSFGFAGTIGHILLEQAPLREAPACCRSDRVSLLLLSARSTGSLEELRRRYLECLRDLDGPLSAFVNAAARQRQHFLDHRLIAIGADAKGLAGALVAANPVQQQRPARICFLFTGQGAQHAGMGRALYDAEPAFRRAIDRVDAAMSPFLGGSIRDLMFAADALELHETRYTQPAMFAFGYALAQLWRGWGVEPDTIIGHSIGEVAALVHAGSLTLDAAASFIVRRAGLMQSLKQRGGMMAVRLSAANVSERIADTSISIAAINGREDVVVAGPDADIDRLSAEFSAQGISARRLKVSHAFHSALMDPLLEELEAVAENCEARAPRVRFISTLSGDLLSGAPDPAYWRRHAREPVRFASALGVAIANGCDCFIEIGPRPLLVSLAGREAHESGLADGLFLASAREGESHPNSLMECLGALYLRGVDFNLEAAFRGPAALPAALPSYPFDRRSYWLEYRDQHEGPSPQLPQMRKQDESAELSLSRLTWTEAVLPQNDPAPAPRLYLIEGGGAAGRAVAESCAEVGVIASDAEALPAAASGDSILVWLGALAAHEAPQPDALWRYIAYCQALYRARLTARIVVVTRGGQRDGTAAPAQAAFWGATRALAIECPDLQFLLVDVNAADDPARVLATIAPRLSDIIPQEDMLAWDGAQWLSPRLEAVPAFEAQPGPVGTDGTYLICGGLGALGGHVLDWLVACGVRDIIVTGRGEPGSRARSTFQRYGQAGVDIRYVRADVANETDMRNLFREIDESARALRGVFHCAGIGRFDTIDAIDEAAFREATQAKADGSWILHCLTCDRSDVEHFVVFTSIAGIWGSRFQIHYGAANAYQDALARLRRARGLPALAIAWGAWGGGAGLSEVDDSLLQYLHRAGISRFEPQRAITTLAGLIATPGNWIAAEVDWRRFAPLYRTFGRSDLLARLAPATEATASRSEDCPDWTRLSAADRRCVLESFVRTTIATVLRIDAGEMHDDVELIKHGLDSILVMDFARACRQKLGVDCALRAIFESATPGGLVDYLEGLAASCERTHEEATVDQIVPDLASRHEPFPLTDLQYAYWAGRDPQFTLGNVSCHAYLESEIVGAFDLARLEAAWNLLIARHDALRLVIDDHGMQRILAEVPRYQFRLVDLTTADAAVVDDHLSAWREEMSHQVLDSTSWPMFDLRASKLLDGRTRLHFSIDMLINDVASSQTLWSELGRVYRAGSIEAAGLEPFTISFRDYVVAKANPSPSRQAIRQRDWAYWMERLPLLPPPPQLPLAVNPEQVARPRFVRHAARCDQAQWSELRRRARSFGVTPATLLIGVFGEVLAAWSDQLDFTLNLTIFDRLQNHPDVPRLVGDFTCVTLLAVDCREPMPLAARLQTIQKRMLEDLEHRSVSAVEVLREKNRGNDRLVGAPVVFTSQLGMHDPTKGTSDGDPLGQVVYGITQTPQVWLDYQAAELDDGLLLNWDVVEGLFPEGVIEAMFKANADLLAALATADDAWTRAAGALLPQSQREVRRHVNATKSELPLDTLDNLFFETAAREPDRIAVIAGDTMVSYGELASWSRRLATRLRAEGIRPGDRVAVVISKGPEQAAACLAILSQGGVYVPLDPAMPTARMAKVVAGSGIGIVLVQQYRDDCVAELGVRVLVADLVECRGCEETEAAPGRSLNDEAYVIYTSGSTGTPKGVVIDHRGAANTVLDVNRRFGVGPDDRVFGFSALGFDLSVYDLFGTFAAGATLVLPEADGTHDPRHWSDLVQRYGVSVWNSVPAVFDLLLDETNADLASLRLVLLSGDWIPLKLPTRLRDRVQTARLIALGGATEASIWSNWFEVRRVEPHWRSIPYGFPLSNQSYRVLDPALRDRPDWVVGDLYIGGVGVALGYDGDAERTADAFIVHPDGERLYRTGDLARYWPDGTIEFLGRRDGQVKIAGHRIELGEIESALTSHHEVLDAVVDVVGAAEGSRRLVAWVSLGDDGDDLQTTVVAEAATVERNGKDLGRAFATSWEASPWGNDELADFWGWQELIARQCVRDLLASQSAFGNSDRPYTLPGLERSLGLTEKYRALLPRWLSLLETSGELRRNGGDWFGQLAGSDWDLIALQAGRFGVPPAVIARLRDSADRRHAVLRGEESALAVFYDEGSGLSPEQLAKLHPCATRIYADVGCQLARIAAESDRPLRILELGARAGEATREWLAAAAAAPIEVTITDPSSLLLDDARARQPDAAASIWRVFDPDRSPTAQGFVEHEFDVIVAFNALHRSDDVNRVLSNCRRLLRPAGLLIGVELTINSPLLDVTVALIESGFDQLQDLRRGRGAPLLSGEEWRGCLQAAGFADVAAVTPAADAGLYVLAARNSDRVKVFEPDKAVAFLERHLPAYMVPRQIVRLDGMPLSPNGKVDRKRLPRPDQTGQMPKHGQTEAPRTSTECKLAEIWSELLGTKAVGRDSSFFEGGGDSLIAVRMVERVRSRLGRRLALRDVFAAPVLYQLAERLDGDADVADVVSRKRLASDIAARHDPFPLTDVQQAYWIGRQGLFPLGGVSTHLYVEIDVKKLPLGRLEKAWNRLVRRHDMLRAVIDERGMQRVLQHTPVYHFLGADLSDADQCEIQNWLERQRADMSHRVYDASVWPLFEIRAARLSESVRLLISIDNLVCDGRSMVLLLHEWAMLARDPDRDLAPLEIGFRDVVLHLVSEQDGAQARRALDYWIDRIGSLPSSPNLPLIGDPAALTPPRFRRLEAVLDAPMWQALRSRTVAAGLTPNAVLLTAYGMSLRAGGGGDRFTLNLTLFQRPELHPQIDDIVGDFTSLLLVAFEERSGDTFTEQARRLQERLWIDLDHADVSAVRVIREAARRGGNIQALAAPVVFTSGIGVDGAASGLGGAALGELTWGITQTPQVWIDHQVVERDGRLVFNWDYVDGLFAQPWIEAVFGGYRDLLVDLAQQAEAWEIPTSRLVPGLDTTLVGHATRAHGPQIGQPAAKAVVISVGAGRDMEGCVSEAFARELSRDDIDPARNVFELGVSSLVLIRIHQRLRRDLGCDFPVVTMFEHPTICGLARYLSGAAASAERHQVDERLAARQRNAKRRRPSMHDGSASIY